MFISNYSVPDIWIRPNVAVVILAFTPAGTNYIRVEKPNLGLKISERDEKYRKRVKYGYMLTRVWYPTRISTEPCGSLTCLV